MPSNTDHGTVFEIPKATNPPTRQSATPSSRKFKPKPHGEREYYGTLPDGREVRLVVENDERYHLLFWRRILQRHVMTIDNVPVQVTGVDVGPGPGAGDPIYRIFHTPEGDFAASLEDQGRKLRLL